MDRMQKIKYILHIIDQLFKKQDRRGETTIQKLVYFIIKAKLLPFDYHYTLYNYGPYSFPLKSDLTLMEDSRMVFKVPDPSGYGFNYVPNKQMDFVNNTLKEMRFQRIDTLIKKFREIPAKNLGLLATFIYIREKYNIENDNELIEGVREIKPMFSNFELEGILTKYNDIIKGNIEEFIILDS